MHNSSSCKICGKEKLNSVNLYNIDYYSCENCGILFLKDIPTKDELQNYYKTEYKLTQTIDENTEFRRIFRIPEQLKIISDIRKYKSAPATILDIGCDKGFFLDEARRWGYIPYGVELSDSGRNYTELIGIKAFSSIVEITEKIDIITMWHSLEHLDSPVDELKNIHSKMSENSYIFIRVPDFNCFWRKVFKHRWVWFQPENHYFHYSEKSLSEVLKQSGFEVINIESRKANFNSTKKMFCLLKKFFAIYFNKNTTFIELIKRKYQDVTGIELYAVAKKLNK